MNTGLSPHPLAGARPGTPTDRAVRAPALDADFSAGRLTFGLWHHVQPTIAKIESLPFLNELAHGTLDRIAFVNYIQQDSLYLIGYARAMALLAAKAASRPEARFWAQSCATAITVEEGMHQALLDDTRLAPARAQLKARAHEPSPTTQGYVSYLIAHAATESYAVGVAGVLPCFWVYAHVAKILVKRSTGLPEGHPYATWLAAYDSAKFDASTRHAVGILEAQLAGAGETTRQAMQQAFAQACVYEWHFWATAHELQGWEIPTAKPPAPKQE